jgi:putrescine:ornithine antiporter
MSVLPVNKQKMGVAQLTVTTVINMMGSGIILLPAYLAQVGTISILAWIVTTIGATLCAYCFARAGTFSRREGGMGGYAEYAHGTSGNFMTNYTYLVSCLISNVAIGITVIAYAATFFDKTLGPWSTCLATVGVLWLAAVLNFWGPRFSGRFSAVSIWGVIIPVAGVAILGWFWFSGHMYVADWNPYHGTIFHGVSGSIAITLWAFLGLESASANSDAVENPKRSVPIAVMGGTIGTAVLCIASTSVVAGIVPHLKLANSNAPYGLAFSYMFTPWVGKLVIGLMVISCFGSLFAWQFTTAQVARTSALRGYLPKVFAKITDLGAPILGLIIVTVIQTGIAFLTVSPTLIKQFTILVDLSVVLDLIPYLTSFSALAALQRKEGVSDKDARVTNVVAVFATIYCLYAIWACGITAIEWGSLATFAGWILYSFCSRKFLDETPDAIPVAAGLLE